MKTIQVLDKQFKLFIEADRIRQAVKRLASELNRDLREKDPLFLVVLNGAFIFASDLLREFSFPCEISFIKLASYSGTKSTSEIRELIGLDEEVGGRTVVFVEDIIDTGLTLGEARRKLRDKGASDIRIATLLLKPDAYKGDYPVEYVGLEIPDAFIVGYGLDYNGHGRNYQDIYQIMD